MNKEEVVDILKFILGAYPKFQINEETPRVWHKMLESVSHETAMKRVITHIKTNTFEPTLHNILKMTASEVSDLEIERQQRFANE